MKIYDSELKNYPHPRSGKAIKTWAQYRGSNGGLKAAEAFEVVRLIR